MNRNLGIAMVAATSFPANHGSPASIREMSQELARRGHRVHVITYPWKQDIPVEGVTIHRVAGLGRGSAIAVGPALARPAYDAMLAFLTAEVVRRERLDIIHAHNYEGAAAGWAAKVMTGRPLLWNSVTNMVDELPSYGFLRPVGAARGIGRALDWVAPRLADRITVVTQDLRQFYRSGGIPDERIHVVPPGVHEGMFERMDGARIRAELGLGDRPVVIYTGVLNEFQGVENLLEGCARAFRTDTEARLVLMGNIVTRAQRDRIIAHLGRLGIAARTVLCGDRPLSDLPHFLAAADVAVVPRPNSPGFPVKLLNYMVAGKAIVAAAGSAKNVEHERNGLVVPNGDAIAMGAAIARLLADPAMRAHLGAEARRTIPGRYDWASIASSLEAIYDLLLVSREQEVGFTAPARKRRVRA